MMGVKPGSRERECAALNVVAGNVELESAHKICPETVTIPASRISAEHGDVIGVSVIIPWCIVEGRGGGQGRENAEADHPTKQEIDPARSQSRRCGRCCKPRRDPKCAAIRRS